MVIENQSIAHSVLAPQTTRIELLQVLIGSGRHVQRELAGVLEQSIQNWCDILEISALQAHLVTDSSTSALADSAFSSLTGKIKYLSYATTFASALASPESSKLYCVLASASRFSQTDDLGWLRYQLWSQNPHGYAVSQRNVLARLDQVEGVESSDQDPLSEGAVVRVAQKTRYYEPCKIWSPFIPVSLKKPEGSQFEEPLKQQWPPLYTEMDRDGFFLGLTMVHQMESNSQQKGLLQIEVFESELQQEKNRSDLAGVVERRVKQVLQRCDLPPTTQAELFLGVRSRTIGSILATELQQKLPLEGIYILNSWALLCCGQALGEMLRLRKKGHPQILFEMSGQDKLRWVVVSDIER